LESHRTILDDMTWLEGNWAGTFDSNPFEAAYTSPKGGVIMSTSKDFGDTLNCFFEFEKFALIGDTLNMTPYPAGKQSDNFPLIDYDKERMRAVFENKNHDFPTTFVYQRTAPDTLEIIVSGELKGKQTEYKAVLKLKQEQSMSDEPKYALAELQKKFAVEFFNLTWEYLDKKDRTPDDDEKMLQLAYASTLHWRDIGNALNQARGEWMISHVNVILGRKEAGLHHALRSLEICTVNSYGDFDLAFGYEAAARAYALNGNKSECEKYFKLADDAGKAIAEEEDRKIFFDQLQAGPWFGVR
jgi:hypothetical protein